ncbi:MAG TPA: hypothetical protein VJH22_04575, partial [Candidatus Nanoarchaeia archaeon]|nr:hypothetical protein [Candidatus Nanoarchaeia archaeon]
MRDSRRQRSVSAIVFIFLLVLSPIQIPVVSAQQEDPEEKEFDFNKDDLSTLDLPTVQQNIQLVPEARLRELSKDQIRTINDPAQVQRIIANIPDERLEDVSDTQIGQVEDSAIVERLALRLPESRINALTSAQVQKVEDPEAVDRLFTVMASPRIKEFSEEQAQGALTRAEDLGTLPEESVANALFLVHPNLERPSPIALELTAGITYVSGKLVNRLFGELDLAGINAPGAQQVLEIKATSEAGKNGFILVIGDRKLAVGALAGALRPEEINQLIILPDGRINIKTSFGQDFFLDQGDVTSLPSSVGTALITKEGTVFSIGRLGIQIRTHGSSTTEPTIIHFDHKNNEVIIAGPAEVASFTGTPETGDFRLLNMQQSIARLIFDESNQLSGVRGENVELTMFKQREGQLFEDVIGGNLAATVSKGELSQVAFVGRPQGRLYGIGDLSSQDSGDRVTLINIQTGEGERPSAERPLRDGEGSAISRILEINQARSVFEQEVQEKLARNEPVTLPIFNEESGAFEETACADLNACRRLVDVHYSEQRIGQLFERLGTRTIDNEASRLLREEVSLPYVPEILRENGYRDTLGAIEVDEISQNYLSASRVYNSQSDKYDIGAVAKRGLVDITTAQFSTKTESDSAYFSWLNSPRPCPDEAG